MEEQPLQPLLDDLVQRIVQAVRPLRVLLFGSAAGGTLHEWSDLDLLVVVPDGTHRRETARTIYRAIRATGVPVDVVVCTPTDLGRYGDSPVLIYREALTNGRDLYVA